MKHFVKGFLFLFFCANFIQNIMANMKHFPIDDYNYQQGYDLGIKKYRANSLYGTKKIVLTFDDGPNVTQTPKILDLLKKYGVKATFFINTVNLNKKTIPIAYRILEEGHILASHDFNHRNNNEEDEDVFKEELSRSILDIKNLENQLGIKNRGIYFRFPFGSYGMHPKYHHLNAIKEVSEDIYRENCINFAFWDIDTKDWGPNMTSQEIAQNVKTQQIN